MNNNQCRNGMRFIDFLYKLNVKLLDNNGYFRNTEDVLKDIAQKFDTLSEEEKKEMSEAAMRDSFEDIVNMWYRKEMKDGFTKFEQIYESNPTS